MEQNQEVKKPQPIKIQLPDGREVEVDPTEEVVIKLKLFELDYLISTLEEKPFKEVAGIVMNLINQGREQIISRFMNSENSASEEKSETEGVLLKES